MHSRINRIHVCKAQTNYKVYSELNIPESALGVSRHECNSFQRSLCLSRSYFIRILNGQ